MACSPPTTDGPATMISPSSASVDREAGQRAAGGLHVPDVGQRHGAAGLGEPVGRAGRASPRRARGRAASGRRARRRASRTAATAAAAGGSAARAGSGTSDATVTSSVSAGPMHGGGAREPGAQQDHEPADVRQRQRAQPAPRLDHRRHGAASSPRCSRATETRAVGTPVVPLVCTTRPNPSPFSCLPLSISVITCPAPASRHDGSRRSTGTTSTPASRHACSAIGEVEPGRHRQRHARRRDAHGTTRARPARRR